MKADLFNQEGEKVGEINLPKEIFNIPFNSNLVHQAVLYYQALKRKPTASTKDRSEVSGGGRKPWRQKGTGRARHGSIRSPIWKGGGVTFGPIQEKKYEKKLPSKMRRKALFMVLSQKLQDGEIIFLDDLKFDNLKTKSAQKIIDNLSRIKTDLKDKSKLILLDDSHKDYLKFFSNIKNIGFCEPTSLNPYILLLKKYLIIEKGAIEKFKDKIL